MRHRLSRRFGRWWVRELVQACSTTTPQAHKLSHAVVGCSTRAKATAVAASLVSPQRRKKRRGKTKRVRDRRPPPAAPQTKTDSSILVAASLRLPRSAAPSPPANLTVSSHPPLPSPPLPSVLFRCQYRRVLFSVFGVLGAASAASRRPPPLGVSTSARAGARGFEPAPAPRCSPTLRSSGGRGGGRPFLCRTVGRCGFHFFFWWRSSSHFVGV
jgi:hypothetical protein